MSFFDWLGNSLNHGTDDDDDDAQNQPAVYHMAPLAELTLNEKMVLALSLLKDSIGSGFLAQFWVPEKLAGLYMLRTREKPYLCFPHPMLEAYRRGSVMCGFSADILGSCWPLDLPGRVFTCKVPEWTSSVVHYKEPPEYSRRSLAISRGIQGTIAFPVFDSDHDRSCCAVLELVTMEEKPNFDCEMEKVFQALQAVNLRSNASPRLRPECFSSDQRAVLAELNDVIRAVCQTYRFPLALTWIPCDYAEEAVDEISKLHARVGNSRLNGKCVLCIERTACYVEDEEMQGFVHACEQRYIEEGQGVAWKALQSNNPVFNADVKTYHITEYPLVHHARKYNLNAAIAIRLSNIFTGDDNYILEFFLPDLMTYSSELQDLFMDLPVILQGMCTSPRIVSDAELVGKQGSKVRFAEAPVQTALFKRDLNLIDQIPLHASGSKNVGVGSDDPHEQAARVNNCIIEPVPNDDGKMVIICANNKRRKVSEVWKGFDKVKGENDEVWAVCKGCNKKYPGESKKGASNLHKHLRSCSEKRQRDAEQHSLPSDLGRNFVFDQERSRLNLARMIMKFGCPLNMVQHDFFETFFCDLQPTFQLSQETIQADVLVVYREEKEKLIEHFHNLSSLFSLTVDMQPYNDKEVYCCFTLHFIDDGWELRKSILAFRNLQNSCDAGALHQAIKSVLVEWNINKKVNLMFAVMTSPNVQVTLKSKLYDQVSCCNGDVFCVSSYAQILDLLVRDGFYEIQSVLHKIRESISYVNGPLNKRMKFQEAINKVKLQDKKIVSQDDPTRWETTFVMLKRALHFREAFTHQEKVDCDFKVNPSAEEWDMAMDVCMCLKVFHKSLYNSSSSVDAYFLNVCYIYTNLLQWAKTEHVHVRSMAKRMKMTLDKYWCECGLALGIILVLDPRFKLKFLLYGYEQIYGTDANLRLLKFRNRLTCIYNKYANDGNHLASSTTKSNDMNCLTSYHRNFGDKLQGFCEWVKQKYDNNTVESQKSDLDRYLEEPLESLDNVSDILAWWCVNSTKFPVLGKMARDFLAVHVSNSTFRIEATKKNPAFNGLHPEVIEALICGKDWLESLERKSEEGSLAVFLASDSNVRCNSPNLPVPKYLAGPFLVSKPVSREDLKLIQYIFDPLLEESEIVVRCEHYCLTRGELCSLRPQNCLDDMVISMMSDALTLVERQKEVYVNWYLPIYFAKFAYDPSECISFAKKQRIRENHMSALFCCEKVFVPVFDNARSHFYLYILYLKKEVVEIWDSLAESSDSEVVTHRLRNLLVSLDILFKDDIDQNYPDGWSFANFGVERPTNIPQQPNGYDCGVYVIKFMLAPEEVKHHDFVFDSDEERLKVVLRLLDGDVNLCRSNLTAKAEAYQQNSETSDSLSFASWQEMKT